MISAWVMTMPGGGLRGGAKHIWKELTWERDAKVRLNFSQLVIQKGDREKNVIIYKAKPCSKNINVICIIAKKKGGKPLGGLSSWCVRNKSWK